MSPVSIDDDDSIDAYPKKSGVTNASRTTRSRTSGHEESLAGMYYIADCDDDDDVDDTNVRCDTSGVVEKRGTGSTSESSTISCTNRISHGIIHPKQQLRQHQQQPPQYSAGATPRKQLQQIEQEVLAKQQGRTRSNAATKGVMRDQRTAKTSLASSGPRTMLSSDTNLGNHAVETRKENDHSTGNIPSELQRLESDLEHKIRQNQSKLKRAESRRTPASLLQSDIEAKRWSSSRPLTLSEEIARLDARIAARNSKVRLASKRNVLRATEQDSIETPIISNVERNPVTMIANSATVKPLQREGSSSTLVEQYHNSLKLDTEKDEIIPNSAMYSGLDGGTTSYGLIANGSSNDDLEYGVCDDDDYGLNGSSNNKYKGLAVAFAVQDEDEDMYIPSAVEFDPDAKPPTYKNRRFRLYACLAIIVVIVGTITASVGITLTPQTDAGSVIPDEVLPYRATLGIRESIERIVGSEKLDDLNSPYRKALDWIQDVDPLTLTPNDDNFLQRYLAVYFFYATSVKHPWSGGCNPPVNDEDESCFYQRLSSLDPVTYTDIPWKRWLTKQFECTWAGIYCDDAGQIRSLEFSTYLQCATLHYHDKENTNIRTTPFVLAIIIFCVTKKVESI